MKKTLSIIGFIFNLIAYGTVQPHPRVSLSVILGLIVLCLILWAL